MKYYYTAIRLGKKFKFLPGKTKGNRFSAGIKENEPIFVISEERNRNKNIIEAKNEDLVLTDGFIYRLLYSEGLQIENHSGMHLAFVLNSDNKYEAVGIPFAMASNPWIDDIPYLYMLGDISIEELLLLNTIKCNLYPNKTFEENLEEQKCTYFFENSFADLETGKVSDEPPEDKDHRYTSREKKKEFWEAIVPPEIMRKPIKELFIYNTVEPELSLYHYMKEANLKITESHRELIQRHMWYLLDHKYYICHDYHAKLFPTLKLIVLNLKNAKSEFANSIRSNADEIIKAYQSENYSKFSCRYHSLFLRDIAESLIMK
jgi:hypothetical protein